MNRQESSDNNGAVRGSYGYTDPYGVFRHVDYVADEYGFRAEVKSNEPGMGTQSPANVQIYAEPPPAGVIVERPYYHPQQHLQGAQVGQASGQQPSRRNPTGAATNTANRQIRPVRVPVATGTRTAVYPFVPPQPNAYSTNAVSSNQYPSTVSNQYAANNAASASITSQYPSAAGQQASSGSYSNRNPYLGTQNYASQSSSQVKSATASSSSSSAQTPIVARPYDGPTYKIGNPHVTDLVRAEREESGSILLPTVVTTGNAPTTLVKHIHAYPAAPVTK
ncbi:Cuticle protein 16.8, partial [Stegodyphus mimosarum]